MEWENWPDREQFVRTEMLLGRKSMEKLRESRIAVFGVGGVGGYVVEALARSGVGAFELIDNDTICCSNLNRQIIAVRDTIGRQKTEVTRERILSINPFARVTTRNCFFLPENAGEFDFTRYSYVVDAVDTVTAKIELVLRAGEAGVPIISSMGTGNKLNPAMLQVADIYKTKVCPLAKVMRRELKARGVKGLKVVYSEELPLTPLAEGDILGEERPGGRRSTPGSTSFVPPVAGMIIASEVIRDLTADL